VRALGTLEGSPTTERSVGELIALHAVTNPLLRYLGVPTRVALELTACLPGVLLGMLFLFSFHDQPQGTTDVRTYAYV
jgi:hypothetical protein